MKVAIWGWNGATNVGDDAMTYSIMNGVCENIEVTEFYIVSIGQESAMPFLDDFRAKCKVVVDTIPFLLRKVKLLKSIYMLIFVPIIFVFRSDLVIIGGGSIFHSNRTNLIYYNILRFRKLFFKSKLRIISLSVSAGPFYSLKAEKRFLKILELIDYICVRDMRSFKYCTENATNNNYVYKPDAALILSFPNLQVEQKRYVSIILRQGFLSENIYDVLSKSIVYLKEKYPQYQVLLLSACELNDSNENDSIAIDKMNDILERQGEGTVQIYKYTGNPVEFYRLLSMSKLTISMRLHGSIISRAVQTPFISISYHQKCKDFYIDMGLDRKFLIENDTELKIEKMRELIDELIYKEIEIDKTFTQLRDYYSILRSL